MAQKNSSISLNFFPLSNQEFEFGIYRKKVLNQQELRPSDDCKRWNLPELINQDALIPYNSYWTYYNETENFDKFICNQSTNNDLTKHYLFHLLKHNCQPLPKNEFEIDPRNFSNRIYFVIREHPNGRRETVWLEPYFLRTKTEFGFLTDFALHSPDRVQTKRDLELSLAQKNNRPNKDFYIDRFEKLKLFVSKFHEKLFPLFFDNLELNVEKNLRNLPAQLLKTKTYVFAKGESSSQFSGIKSYSPLKTISSLQKIYFVYRPQDKPFSYDLYRALEGKSFQTFDGMAKTFKFDLSKTTVSGIPIKNFDSTEIEKVCNQIPQNAEGRKDGVPIVLIPFEKFGNTEDNKSYYRLKHKFLEHGISSQCIRLQTLKSENTFKWSVANIGLQIFAKLGGEPWKVKPANERCLIIGIGQAHRKERVDLIDEKTGKSYEKFKIKKSFAYTVLTDSSGIYKDLIILSSGEDEADYLKNLKENLRGIIEKYDNDYDKFVIHTTFSINKDEIKVIKNLVNQMSEDESQHKEFVVMKFNDKNKYFGYASENNSLIPYESSFMKLSSDEYLVWFEGLQYHTSSTTKSIERPVHVQFLYSPKYFNDENKKSYLQDALNLSGANWRGFNAKSFPVSVFYAKEIAKYINSFREINLDETNVDWTGITPWFL
jgi:hypothetical protein